jgi:HJR/Mrr/RecB family endonuclease
MNAKSLFLVAAAVAAFSGVARADDVTVDPVKFEGSRTRAEVMAEAATVSATRSTEPAGSRVIEAPKNSQVNVEALRRDTAQAVRTGQISQGEIGRL